jgi:thiol-disulfide isomerase/thioredoxin
VVNFWATWCAPCIKELPYFQELHDRHSETVRVVLVSLDFPDQVNSKLIPFIAVRRLSPEVVLLNDTRENEWIPKVDPEWSGALPATLVRRGKDRIFLEGTVSREELFKTVRIL